ncbi:HlyD family efflux transporter periplasmic adaptor subunit, partial [bacterium]|nr:HlyD family efflux transporter periplasmic adaptor subunit [bacterium]
MGPVSQGCRRLLAPILQSSSLPISLSLLLCIAAVGCDRGAKVDVLTARRGALVESFVEPAKTRLARTYPVTMPVAGRIARIELEPGDAVKKGQTLVAFDALPLEQALAEARAAVSELEAEMVVKKDNSLEETAAKETQASVVAADESLKAYDAQLEAEKARSDHASGKLERKKTLAEKKVIGADELDDFILAAETALIELRKQQFYRAALKAFIVAVNLGPRAIEQYIGKKGLEYDVLVHKLAQAKARLARAEHDLGLARIVSPIDGVVLERHEQGDRSLPAGQRLLLVGNLDALDVVADVLTQDVLRLREGSDVSLQAAVGREPIAGKVARIEPAGFTKLSSLGVEQQRVNVIISLEGGRGNLGVGYRLQARFTTGAKADALIVPRYSVLQAPDRAFYVLKAADGVIAKQTVAIGLRSDLELEILSGLGESDPIIARPDATMKEGMRVKPVVV